MGATYAAPIAIRLATARKKYLLALRIDFGHVLDEVDNTTRIAPLIVVPGHELDEGGVNHDAGLRVEGARNGARLEVGGHQILIAIAKETLHVTVSPPLDF